PTLFRSLPARGVRDVDDDVVKRVAACRVEHLALERRAGRVAAACVHLTLQVGAPGSSVLRLHDSAIAAAGKATATAAATAASAARAATVGVGTAEAAASLRTAAGGGKSDTEGEATEHRDDQRPARHRDLRAPGAS